MRSRLEGSLPPVHCVLLNYKGWRDTTACLESLLRSDYPALRVVIVDNASPDDSVARIRAWAAGTQEAPAAIDAMASLVSPPSAKPVSLVELSEREAEAGGSHVSRDARLVLIHAAENRGFTGGNNVGLRYLLASEAVGYAWVLNNDTLVAPDALRQMVTVAEREPRCGAVGATLLEYRAPGVVQAAAGGTVRRWHGMVRACAEGMPLEALPRALPRLDFVSGCSFLAPLETLAEVGLLDERLFIYAEDIDWSVRMSEAGYSLAWAREARVWHKGGGATGHGSPMHDYHNIRSSLLFVAKHHRRLVPLALGYVVYRAVLPKLLRRQWRRLAAVARGVRDFFRDRHLMRVSG